MPQLVSQQYVTPAPVFLQTAAPQRIGQRTNTLGTLLAEKKRRRISAVQFRNVFSERELENIVQSDRSPRFA